MIGQCEDPTEQGAEEAGKKLWITNDSGESTSWYVACAYCRRSNLPKVEIESCTYSIIL